MKIAMAIQRLLAITVGIFGFLSMFGEVPESADLSAQAWVTVGGLVILGLSLAWLWICDKEETYFLHHEAR